MREAHGSMEKDCTFIEKFCWPVQYIFKSARQRLVSAEGCKLMTRHSDGLTE